MRTESFHQALHVYYEANDSRFVYSDHANAYHLRNTENTLVLLQVRFNYLKLGNNIGAQL